MQQVDIQVPTYFVDIINFQLSPVEPSTNAYWGEYSRTTKYNLATKNKRERSGVECRFKKKNRVIVEYEIGFAGTVRRARRA